MLFNSFEFAVFFGMVFGLYWRLPHRAQNILLLAASYVFYASWDWRFLSLLLLCTGVAYGTGARIAASSSPGVRRNWLVVSLVVNLGVLIFFKYCNFFLENFYALSGVFGIKAGGSLRIILPMGISFFTFQAMSYTIDVYRRTVKPSASLLDFAVFKGFFPLLIAGPIERATHLLPQMVKPRVWDETLVRQGAYLILLGLFQKMVVADNLAKIVNPVFADPAASGGWAILAAMYAFAFQIFCDFAGYSNVARGLGAMMGFKVMVNFDLPFLATNVQDFWNRWHISLSQWIRDYLYFPLMSVLRHIPGNGRVYTALMIAMTLMGLWHGAAWNFVLFGVYYGILLILYIIIRSRYATLIVPKSSWGKAIWFWARVAGMFQVTALGMMLFRAGSLSRIGAMGHGLLMPSPMGTAGLWGKLVLFSLPVIILQCLELKTKDTFFLLNRIKGVSQIAVFALMVYFILGWGVMTAEEFIYFQF